MTSVTTSPNTAEGHGAAGPVAVVRVENAVRRYGEAVALGGISFEIPAGQIVALLGPNGSGKSTLLRILATLDRQTSGTVRLFGETVGRSNLAALRSRLGVVFQSPALDPLLTVEENLLAQAALFGLRGPLAKERVVYAAERLGITARLADRVGTLSGGLVRRADVARSLLHRPRLLLLDEPTAALDPRARAEFVALLRELRTTLDVDDSGSTSPGAGRITIVLSTHLMDEAEAADRVVLLNRGRLAADSTPPRLRAAAGEMVIRCVTPATDQMAGMARSIMDQAGLETSVETDRDGRTLAVRGVACESRPGATETAIVGLSRAGIGFEYGRPTLSDAFIALTGDPLTADLPPTGYGGAARVPGRER